MKTLFTMRVLRHRNGLSRDLMDVSTLEVFKSGLDGALSNLVQQKLFLHVSQGLEPDGFQGPFQPKPFSDSIIPHFLYLLFFQSGSGRATLGQLSVNQLFTYQVSSLSPSSSLILLCTQQILELLPNVKYIQIPSAAMSPFLCQCTALK